MPIVAQCSCGKRIGLGDAMAGKTVRCPKCGKDVYVQPAAPAAAGKGAVKGGTAAAQRKAAPAVSVSPTLVIGGVVGAVVLAVVLALYFGPWRVGNEWAAMSGRANDEVTDTVLFAIQAYESMHGMYDPRQSHVQPQLQGPASFFAPTMAFSMPRRIPFLGKTNQGNYRGTWDTTTGEINATIETGGWTIGGLVDARKASGSFQMTGREKDGKPSAECDGQPLQIVMPPPEPKD